MWSSNKKIKMSLDEKNKLQLACKNSEDLKVISAYLQDSITNLGDMTFLKKNRSPFYNIKTGKVSGYNDVGQVMFKTLLESHKNIEKRFKKNVLKNFGPGSNYWKNLELRKKYKKIKNWRSLVPGPWIHQNIIETIKNIRLKKKFTGGVKVNESDGYCAALPFFLYGYSFKDIENIMNHSETVTVEPGDPFLPIF